MPLLPFACIAFIGLGLPDPLPGTLWPALRGDYGQPAAALGVLLLAVSGGTMAASILSGRAIAAIGTGGVLAASLGMTALAALGAATAPPWPGLVTLALGRVTLGFVVDRMGPDRLLRLAVVVAALATAGFAFAPAGLDRLAVGLLAVALAPLYPTLMARTPARLGAAAAVHAVGFQVAAATLGAGLLPALLGLAPVTLLPVLLLALAVVLTLLLHRITG